MTLNLRTLRKDEEQLNTANEGFLYQAKLAPETYVRILPPTRSLDEVYYKKVVYYRIGGFNKEGVTLYSKEVFGEPCIIDQTLENIRRKGGNDLRALASNEDTFVRREEFWIPILLLSTDDGSISTNSSFKVVSSKPRILVCGPSLLRSLNACMTSKLFQNDSDDGILDRVIGHNIEITRVKGSKGPKDVSYSATVFPKPMEIDAEYCNGSFDVVDELKKRIIDEYSAGILNNYFYNDDKPTWTNSDYELTSNGSDEEEYEEEHDYPKQEVQDYEREEEGMEEVEEEVMEEAPVGRVRVEARERVSVRDERVTPSPKKERLTIKAQPKSKTVKLSSNGHKSSTKVADIMKDLKRGKRVRK